MEIDHMRAECLPNAVEVKSKVLETHFPNPSFLIEDECRLNNHIQTRARYYKITFDQCYHFFYKIRNIMVNKFVGYMDNQFLTNFMYQLTWKIALRHL